MSIAAKPFEMERKYYEQIKFISPNLYELRRIAEALKLSPAMKSDFKVGTDEMAAEERETFHEISELCDALQEHIDNIVVTAGSLGVFIQNRNGAQNAFFTRDLTYIENKTGVGRCRHYPGKRVEKVVNVSGAGDAFTAGFIAGMLKHKPEAVCVSIGFQAATAALLSKQTVPEVFFDQGHQCWNIPADFKDLNKLN